MIEINLLPVDLRQAEGTPLPRLASILGGSLAVTLGVVLVANYYVIDIPNTKSLQKIEGDRKKNEEVKKAELDKIMDEITKIKVKVAALNNLERNRVRWARLLDVFSKCVPDGCVVRSFQVAPAGQASDGTSGRTFKLTVAGFTSGENNLECTRKLTDMWSTFKNQMAPKEPVSPVATVGGADTEAAQASSKSSLPPKFHKLMALRFDEPEIKQYRPTDLPDMPQDQMSVEQRRHWRKPTAGMDFTIELKFALPPPVQ